MSSWLCALAMCRVHGRAGLCAPTAHVQSAEDSGDLILQHEPHPFAVVTYLAGHRRSLQQGLWSLSKGLVTFTIALWMFVCNPVISKGIWRKSERFHHADFCTNISVVSRIHRIDQQKVAWFEIDFYMSCLNCYTIDNIQWNYFAKMSLMWPYLKAACEHFF